MDFNAVFLLRFINVWHVMEEYIYVEGDHFEHLL